MPDGIELPGHHSHEDHPLVAPVSITMSILAVLIAGATLLSHRAHTEELLLQSQATDQWAYYQAKNSRYHLMLQIKRKPAQNSKSTRTRLRATTAIKRTSAKKRKSWRKTATSSAGARTAMTAERRFWRLAWSSVPLQCSPSAKDSGSRGCFWAQVALCWRQLVCFCDDHARAGGCEPRSSAISWARLSILPSNSW